MALEQMRFGEQLRFEVVTGNVEPERCYVPSLMVQTLVENAVKHGVAPELRCGRTVPVARRLRARLREVLGARRRG